MTFLNPLALLGFIAAGIPLLLHLLNLRKLKTIEFSTLRFVKELQKTQIRKLKLQQILLLVLRTLIIVFAVLAFSRPILRSTLPVFGAHVKSSVVVLVDNSASMDCSDDKGSRMKQARDAALRICSALQDGDEVAVLTSSDVGALQKISFSRNLALINERVQKIHSTPRTTSCGSMLRMASSLLSDAQNVNKEVYLISDMQQNMFEDLQDSVRSSFEGTRVVLVPIGQKTTILGQNLGVDSVAVISAIIQRDKPVDVEAFIRNSSDQDVHGAVVAMSFNGQRVTQAAVDVPAGQVRSILLSASPQQSGAVRASVDVETDALELDNRRYFSFVLPPQPNVLVVGDPERRSFVEQVLKLGSGSDAFRYQLTGPTQSATLNYDNFDVVLLCSNPPSGENARLEEYVRKGGALFLFADDDIRSTGVLCQLFGFGNPSDLHLDATAAAGFTNTDRQHPLFQGVFSSNNSARATVESAKMTHAEPVHGGQEIIAMQDGSFLAESRVGEGKVLYCAVSPTVQWSTFPLTGLFPTILFRSIPYLSAHEQLGSSSLCGSNLQYMMPKRLSSSGRFVVSDPTMVESTRDAALLPAGAVLSLGIQDQCGVTVVKNPQGQALCSFAVNHDRSESRLQFFTGNEAQSQVTKHLREGTLVEQLDADSSLAGAVARARMGTELWKLFVVLAIVCAITEMIIARRTAIMSAQPA